MIRMMFLSGILLTSVSSCINTERGAETIVCDGLLVFAASVRPNEQKVVKLVSDWGNMEKACYHYDDPAGQRFCKVLMPNTSSEFMMLNVKSLLKCTGASIDIKNVYVSELEGDISVFEIVGLDSDIEVNIKFSFGSGNVDDYIEVKSINEPFE